MIHFKHIKDHTDLAAPVKADYNFKHVDGPTHLPEFDDGKKSFWNRPLGRTLRGANRTGKTIYAVLTGVVSMLAGFNLSPVVQALTSTATLTQTQPTMHFTWLTLILLIVIYALGFLTNYGMVKGVVKELLTELRDTAVEVKKAKAASSPGGTDVTDHEQQLILQRAETVIITLYNRVIRKWIAGIFGNTFEKIPTDDS